MTPLDSAISQLQEELDSYGQGTPTQPRESTSSWFLLRATSIGLSYLKRVQQTGVEGDPAAAERLYRRAGQHLKAAEVPEEEVVEKETLPGGILPVGQV